MKAGKNIIVSSLQTKVIHADCPHCGSPNVILHDYNLDHGKFVQSCEDCYKSFEVEWSE